MKSLQQFILERGAAPIKDMTVFTVQGEGVPEQIPNIKGMMFRKGKKPSQFEIVCTSPEGIAAAILMLKYVIAGKNEIEDLSELDDYLIDNKFDLDELFNNAVAIIGNDRVKEIQKIMERV